MSEHFKAFNGELREIDLFRALDDEQLEAVVRTTRSVSLAQGERLFNLGDPARCFFHLCSGQIKLARTSLNGGEKVIEVIRPGNTFAQAVMFMESDKGYPVTAEAIDDSDLLAFDNATIVGLLRESVDTCFRMMTTLSWRLRQQVEEIERLTLHTATCRLAAYLIQQLPANVLESPEVHLTTPKNIIASRLGIQPETFSRIIACLIKDNLIEVNAQDIVLRDIDGLRERIDL